MRCDDVDEQKTVRAGKYKKSPPIFSMWHSCRAENELFFSLATNLHILQVKIAAQPRTFPTSIYQTKY